MAREQEFNTEVALEKATKVFWAEGYEKTSTRQLQKAMNLRESSFYNAFKSKKNLYLQCLDHYNAKVTADRLKALNTNKHIAKKLNDFFDIIIKEQSDSAKLKGCLMTNSLSNDVLSQSEIRKYVKEQFDGFRSHINLLFDEAIKNKELSSDFDKKNVTELLIIHLQGIFKISLITDNYKDIKNSNMFLINSIFKSK